MSWNLLVKMAKIQEAVDQMPWRKEDLVKMEKIPDVLTQKKTSPVGRNLLVRMGEIRGYWTG